MRGQNTYRIEQFTESASLPAIEPGESLTIENRTDHAVPVAAGDRAKWLGDLLIERDALKARVRKLDLFPIDDPVVARVVRKIISRSQIGIEKYGTTLNRDDLSVRDWLTHLQEELLDAANYVEAVMAAKEADHGD